MTSHARLVKSLCRIYLFVYFWLLSCRLVIASRFQPTAVLLALLNFLAPSRPFVVYSQYKEVSWLPRWLMAFYRGARALVSSRCWTRLIALPCGLSRRRSVSESLSRLRHWFPLFVLVSFKSGKALQAADTEWEGFGCVNICRLGVHLFSVLLLQPLIECYMKLKERGGTIGLRLTDTWLRHYQVRGGVKPGLVRALEEWFFFFSSKLYSVCKKGRKTPSAKVIKLKCVIDFFFFLKK